MPEIDGRPALPAKYDAQEIGRAADRARAEFRQRRLEQPVEDYLQAFPSAKAAAEHVVSSLDRVLAQPADKHLVADIVANKSQFSALRSLAAVPISADDLNTLLDATLTRTAVRGNQQLADRLVDLLRACLDPKRSPWMTEARAATAASSLWNARRRTPKSTAPSA